MKLFYENLEVLDPIVSVKLEKMSEIEVLRVIRRGIMSQVREIPSFTENDIKKVEDAILDTLDIDGHGLICYVDRKWCERECEQVTNG